MEIDINYLKEKVQYHLNNIVKYNNKEEDLFCLDIQIIGLCDTFELISHNQAAELRKLIDEIKK